MKQLRSNHLESQHKQLARLRDDINTKQKLIDELAESVILKFCSLIYKQPLSLESSHFFFCLFLVKIRGWLWNYSNCVLNLLAWKVRSARGAPGWKSSSESVHDFGHTITKQIDFYEKKLSSQTLSIFFKWTFCVSP